MYLGNPVFALLFWPCAASEKKQPQLPENPTAAAAFCRYGDGGIRTLVPERGKRISSAPRYDHFDTSPDDKLQLITVFLSDCSLLYLFLFKIVNLFRTSFSGLCRLICPSPCRRFRETAAVLRDQAPVSFACASFTALAS
jgi:hypothetical protein